MNKFTPGPWEVRGKAVVVKGSPRWNNAYNGRICNVQGAGEGKNTINETAKANAQLIAAAPAMLDALESALQSADAEWENKNQGHDWQEACRLMRVAIKAAKGE